MGGLKQQLLVIFKICSGIYPMKLPPGGRHCIFLKTLHELIVRLTTLPNQGFVHECRFFMRGYFNRAVSGQDSITIL